MEKKAIISLRGINKTFGDRHILKDISLNIYKGETFVIMGCSGSGKSTLLYFFTPPCGACKIQTPVIDTLMKKFPGSIFKIDASKHQESARAYGVLGVPFIVMIDKGVVVSAKAGIQQEQNLKNNKQCKGFVKI